MVQVFIEGMIVEEYKKAEIKMLEQGVSIEAIKAMRPKKGESYLDTIATKFIPVLERYIDEKRLRLECNDNGEITHLFVEQQSKSPTGR